MKNIIFLSVFTILLISCSKKDDDNDSQTLINCTNFRIALLNFDSEQLNLEINKLTLDLVPIPIINDEIGHLNNLNELIERLNSNCKDIIATNECYACIETNPVQSEIKIELDSLGNQIERIIDISTPEDDVLVSLRMHNN
jgi:hypothetical protein